MRIARVESEDRIFLARLENGNAVLIKQESQHPAADVLREAMAAGTDLAGGEHIVPLSECRLLAPIVQPSKILCIGLNYREHGVEQNVEIPEKPLVFAKTINAIVGPDQPIVFGDGATDQVDYEAELGVVIGQRVTRATPEKAALAIFGYTAVNDISARDVQFEDGQWTRGKSFDSFAPVGPWIVTRDEIPDPQMLKIACRVNGETLQDSDTSMMMRGVFGIIAYVSQFITLEPGDLIATGTPGGVGFARTPPRFLQDGDVVDVTIGHIGTLSNTIQVRHD